MTDESLDDKALNRDEVQEAIDALLPLSVVQGDAAQRGNPHTKQMVNSSCAWGVTGGERSSHKLRTHVEVLQAFLLASGFKIDGEPL